MTPERHAGSMYFHDPDVVRSFARSRVRVRVLKAAARLGHAYPSQLAHEARVDIRTLHDALFGDRDGERYCVELALARLALVKISLGRRGWMISITDNGATWAEALDDRIPFGLI